MSTPSRCCGGTSVLSSLHLLPLFLSLVSGVQGATLREHRLSGSEPGSYEPGSQLHPAPSAEMLRALRYIQSLSQRTPSETPANDRQSVTANRERDDMESVRSMLQLAAPSRGSTEMDRGLEEREDDNDNTQQWLQAVLTTLQQTEEQTTPQKMTQKVTTHISSPSHPRYTIQPLPIPKQQQLDMEPSSAENYERTSWANPGSRRRHRQYPPMFEDVEEQEHALKRANENAEEQYTPQKLATLQSVFEELSGISTSKSNNKRESSVATTDDEDDDEDDVDDLYRQRKMALEDVMGRDEWEPLEEQIETEEEQRERHGFNSNFEEDDDDEVRRSNQPEVFQAEKDQDPEDIAKLVDYYLLKVLEKKEQEQQKREEASDREQEEQETDREVEKKDADEEEDDDEEERDEEEREINPMRTTLPQSLSQLIKVSQKLQIPPQDVLDLLQNEPKNFRIPLRTLAESRIAPRTHTSTHDAHKTYAAAPHQRPLETSERNNVAQDIMNILELVSAAQLHDKLPQKTSPPKPLRYYERERDLPGYGFPESSRDDYDDTAGEDDELASFLASQMLAQGQRRARLTPSLDAQRSAYGKLERAVQDYLDKSSAEKRPREHKSATTSLDDDRMLKLLQYLEPESADDGETDSEGKPIPEM